MSTSNDARDLVSGLVGDDENLVRAVVSGRQRNRTVPYRRVKLRYVDLKSGRNLQVTSYDQTQAHTVNVPVAEATAALDELLSEGYSTWHIETRTETVQVRTTKKGRQLVSRLERTDEAEPVRAHDRSKRRRLDADDELFRVLGISTADGTLKPSRTAKFRQVQDLLAALEPVVDDAVTPGRALRVVDLGCGNAYLTFGAYRYLSEVRGLSVLMTGVDVKDQSLVHNTEVAERLGVSDRVDFVRSSIAGAEVSEPPDLVLALHACDTATDDALARAVRWEAPVIVAAPCCHHDIQRQLSAHAAPEPYELVTRYGILRERIADVLTDALRAAVLRMHGYRVEVFEFVDSRHTPRNALIRAVRTGAAPSPETTAAYEELTHAWGVRPELARQLGTGA